MQCCTRGTVQVKAKTFIVVDIIIIIIEILSLALLFPRIRAMPFDFVAAATWRLSVFSFSSVTFSSLTLVCYVCFM